MKVVLVTKTVYPFHLAGGTERFYSNLARFLVREGVTVEIVTSEVNSSMKTIEKDHMKVTFISPHVVNCRPARIFFKLFDINVARYLLKRSDYDIVHGGIGLYTYTKFKRKPVVLQILELWEPPCCEHWNPIIRAYMYTLDYFDALIAFKKANKVAVEVEAEAHEVCRLYGVPWSKIFYLPPGVDLERIEEAIKTTDISREDIGVADADLVLICVSRLEPNKGVHILIDALRILNKHLNVRLILVGTGSMELLIKSMIKKYKLEDKVKHFKNVPDDVLYKLYDLADIAVIPTLHEGLPTVLLEAMACGKPVVASRTSEIACIVKNGVNGFLTRPGNPYDIARKVLEAYDRGAIKNLSNAARNYGKAFDWRFLVRRLLKIYHTLST